MAHSQWLANLALGSSRQHISIDESAATTLCATLPAETNDNSPKPLMTLLDLPDDIQKEIITTIIYQEGTKPTITATNTISQRWKLTWNPASIPAILLTCKQLRAQAQALIAVHGELVVNEVQRLPQILSLTHIRDSTMHAMPLRLDLFPTFLLEKARTLHIRQSKTAHLFPTDVLDVSAFPRLRKLSIARIDIGRDMANAAASNQIIGQYNRGCCRVDPWDLRHAYGLTNSFADLGLGIAAKTLGGRKIHLQATGPKVGIVMFTYTMKDDVKDEEKLKQIMQLMGRWVLRLDGRQSIKGLKARTVLEVDFYDSALAGTSNVSCVQSGRLWYTDSKF